MRISDWSSDVCSSDLLLAAGVALFDDLPDREYLIARDRLFLIGLRQRLLNLPLLCAGDLHGDRMRDDAALDPRDQLLLPLFEQQADRAAIPDPKIDLGGDLRVGIATGAPRAHRVDRESTPM